MRPLRSADLWCVDVDEGPPHLGGVAGDICDRNNVAFEVIDVYPGSCGAGDVHCAVCTAPLQDLLDHLPANPIK